MLTIHPHPFKTSSAHIHTILLFAIIYISVAFVCIIHSTFQVPTKNKHITQQTAISDDFFFIVMCCVCWTQCGFCVWVIRRSSIPKIVNKLKVSKRNSNDTERKNCTLFACGGRIRIFWGYFSKMLIAFKLKAKSIWICVGVRYTVSIITRAT